MLAAQQRTELRPALGMEGHGSQVGGGVSGADGAGRVLRHRGHCILAGVRCRVTRKGERVTSPLDTATCTCLLSHYTAATRLQHLSSS